MSMSGPSDHDRAWAAVCYLGVFVAFPVFMARPRSEFLARHCRQGVTLCAAEIVLLIALGIIDATLGLLPLIGLLLTILLRLVVLLACLVVSVLGIVKALGGETWRLPFLDDFSDRIPISADTADL